MCSVPLADRMYKCVRYLLRTTYINPAVGGLHISGLRIQLSFGLHVLSEMRSRGGRGQGKDLRLSCRSNSSDSTVRCSTKTSV